MRHAYCTYAATGQQKLVQRRDIQSTSLVDVAGVDAIGPQRVAL